MKTLSYTTIDRQALSWPSGPWDNEPDKVQWPDMATGLPCLAVRHPDLGHWCGYVGVDNEHPCFGKNWEDVPGIDIHGGLTFSDHCQPDSEETGICHIPGEGQPDHVWWFGFDCAHYGDSSPQLQVYLGTERHQEYRTLKYVKEECGFLARQLSYTTLLA